MSRGKSGEGILEISVAGCGLIIRGERELVILTDGKRDTSMLDGGGMRD